MARRRLTAELGDWIASLRFSGFTIITVGLLIVGALILTPTLSTYVQQQREIAELRESVAQHRENVAEIDAERLNWQDPAYVRAQARGRLFFVMPGEIQLSVISDSVIPAESSEVTEGELTEIKRNWAHELAASTLVSGVTDATPDQLLGVRAAKDTSDKAKKPAPDTPASDAPPADTPPADAPAAPEEDAQ